MKIGLKVWACNPIAHRDAAIQLAEQGLCDFAEIYVVPGMLDKIRLWQSFPNEKVIHAPHLGHHFNLADAELRESNRAVFSEVQQFADQLQSNIIICHGGTGGTPEESVRQLSGFNDPRIVLENKPFWQHPDYMPHGDRHCRGAVFEEFVSMVNALNVRICHDVAHTVCMANSLQLDPISEIRRFESLAPVIHHLSDLASADDQLDTHEALGQGELDWITILKNIDQSTRLTLETPKRSASDLDDFAQEVRLIRQNGF